MSDGNKLDKIAEDITEIKVTLGKQEENLKEHMRRSLANEAAVEILKEELKPIKTHVDHVNGAIKFIALLGLFASISAALVKVFELF